MEAETTDAVISNQGVPKIEKNQPIIFWTLLILAVLGGGIVVAVLLTKKKR